MTVSLGRRTLIKIKKSEKRETSNLTIMTSGKLMVYNTFLFIELKI